MKFNKVTYYSFFFLSCFLASFSVNAAKALNIAPTEHQLVKQRSLSYIQKSETSALINDFLFEENENEDEYDFTLQTFIAPFLIAPFLTSKPACKIFSVNPVTEKTSNPIYIKVRNFRI